MVLNARLAGSTFASGDRARMDWEVLNRGDVDARSSWAGIYLSADATITTDDELLDYELTVALASGERDTNEYEYFYLPEDLSAGTYYIGVVADYYRNYVGESNEANNASPAFDILIA